MMTDRSAHSVYCIDEVNILYVLYCTRSTIFAVYSMCICMYFVDVQSTLSSDVYIFTYVVNCKGRCTYVCTYVCSACLGMRNKHLWYINTACYCIFVSW